MSNAQQQVWSNSATWYQLLGQVAQLLWVEDEVGNLLFCNRQHSSTVISAFDFLKEQLQYDDLYSFQLQYQNGRLHRERFEIRARCNTAQGFRWHLFKFTPDSNERDKQKNWYGTATDERAIYEMKLRESISAPSFGEPANAISDTTEQKDFTTKLEDLVQSRTAELTRSNEDLQQFAHVASHDLKEPLRKIQLFTNLLRSEFNGNLPGNAELYLQKITKSVSRMNAMIDGILKYSGVEANDSCKDVLDVNQLLLNVHEDLELLVKEKNAKISFDTFPAWPLHKILAYQLFYNLIYNSLKFSRAELSPEISVYRDISAKTKGLHIVVADNGIGFEPSENENIFRTFRRLHSKDQYEGSGLGLALCKKIMERHGGTITAEGKPNEGATFRLYFPEQV